MKTFPALYIDNGVIKANEFPVEPEPKASIYADELILRRYEQAFASAKANAVECENQEGALGLAIITCPSDAILLRGETVVGVQDGIYRFPYGWDYRVENRIAKREDAPDFKVAILYRTDEQPQKEAVIYADGPLTTDYNGRRVLCTFNTIPIRTLMENTGKSKDKFNLPDEYYIEFVNTEPDAERPVFAKICKSKQPEPEESQEDVWEELFTTLYYECEMTGTTFTTEEMINILKREGFTITQRK